MGIASAQIMSGKALEESMYWQRTLSGCVRLMNKTQAVGCSFGPTEAALGLYNKDTDRPSTGKVTHQIYH